MNRSRSASVAHAVRARIERAGPDRLWTYADFPDIEDRMALAAALSRLARNGELVRVRRGVYYRPKPTIFGASRPDPEALVDAVLRHRGDTPVASGVGAYNRLGLTTQVPSVVTRATRRRGPRTAVAGVRLHVSERPLEAQRGIRAEERAALDALRDVTRIPDAPPAAVLHRLGQLIRAGDLDYPRLTRFAGVEPPRVRALLGALGEELRARDSGTRTARRVPTAAIEALRADLNPLTSFRLPGVRDALPHAADAWRIK
jgi:hypothetical protein